MFICFLVKWQQDEHIGQRIFSIRIKLFELSEEEIITRYRLSSHAILLEEIKNYIESLTQRSHSILAVVKLLAPLQILASGSFQTGIAVLTRWLIHDRKREGSHSIARLQCVTNVESAVKISCGPLLVTTHSGLP